MLGGKCGAARQTNAYKVSKKCDTLTMWQTPSTSSTSLSVLSTALVNVSGYKCELSHRIWPKHRTNISINNTEVQSHTRCRSRSSMGRSRSRRRSDCNTSKVLSSNSTVSKTRTTTTTMTLPTPKGKYNSRRSRSRSWRQSFQCFRPNNCKISILHCLLMLCILCDATQATLRNVNLLVEPPAVRRGQSVVLRCEYQLDGAPLYSIKFYRGQFEFYRFTPGEYPHTKVFQYPGIKVDESSSNATLVLIRNVSFGLSGNFSCEVTADAPLYSTATAYAQMQVVEFPEKRPQLFTEHTRYEPGDVLRANCSTPPSRPRAELRFTINHIPVTTEETQYIRTVDNLIASRLSLKLQLQAVHFAASSTTTTTSSSNTNTVNANGNISGRATNVQMTNALGNVRGGLMLRCTAQIGDLYQEYKEIELGTPQKDPVPARVTLSSDSGLRNFLETYFYTSAANRMEMDVIGSFFVCSLISLFWITRIGS